MEKFFIHTILIKIADYLNTKPKNLNIKNLLFADNKIIIFLQNSYILVFEVSGEVKIVKKLPSKLNQIQF